MATPSENKTRTRLLIDEVFGRKNVGHAGEVLAEDFVDHAPLFGGTASKASALEGFQRMADAAPDLKVDIHELIASDDRVAVRATFRGTDTGGFLPGAPATNKPFAMDAIDIVRWSDGGQVLEHWGIVDAMGAMIQLGLAPPPGAGA